jgi:hypothetical protein
MEILIDRKPSLRAKRSNPSFLKYSAQNGLLRFARNDDEGWQGVKEFTG